jgi:hypothetical protein
MHKRFAIAVVVGGLVAPITATSAAVAHGKPQPRPDTIDLPAGFAGEGVATGAGNTFYAGSRTDGRIARGNLRAGTSEVFVSNAVVKSAVGLKADVRHRLLWVSGGGTGKASVYDLKTGALVTTLTLTTAASFINDVVVTREAAYFTNSLAKELYRVPVSRKGVVGTPKTIPLSGPAADFVPGFNLNGIAASRDGRTLIVVNSAKGVLYTVDPTTGGSAVIDIGGVSVQTGDGLLLSGKTLFVLQNGNAPGLTNQIVVIRLRRDLTAGRVVDTITSKFFETATTLAKHGDTLIAVNAQFVSPPPIDPEAEVVLIKLGH